MSIAGAITNLFKSASFQVKLKSLQMIALSDLQKAIMLYFYNSYDPKYYERTYDLYNSPTASDIEFEDNNTLSFSVYLDPEKMQHKSIVGSTKGQFVDIATWMNDGFEWKNWSGGVDYFHKRPESQFIERAIEEIKSDLNRAVEDLINVEVSRITK